MARVGFIGPMATNLSIATLLLTMCSLPASPPVDETASGPSISEFPDSQQNAPEIVDVPVRFTVVNRNDSLLPCAADGLTYGLDGHLTGPASSFTTGSNDVTIYQHGQSAGEWFWRLGGAGPSHAEGMAALGEASLTFDRLGYGTEEQPDGMSMCLGSQASMTAQIIEQVRDGSYEVLDATGSMTEPRSFEHVSLAGHGSGAQVAQITAYSFADTPRSPDSLILMAWSGTDISDHGNARFFGGLAACMQGGVPAHSGAGPSDPEQMSGGYTYVDIGRTAFARANFVDPTTARAQAAAGLQKRVPCGDLGSQVEGLAADSRNLHRIGIPVLLAFADRDTRMNDGRDHAALFTGSSATEVVIIPNAGHYFIQEPAGESFRPALSAWLGGQR